MATKLTLYMDDALIADAKSYAKREGVSLSQMVARFFRTVTEQKSAGYQPSAKVRALTGVLSADVDLQQEYGDYLEEKYR